MQPSHCSNVGAMLSLPFYSDRKASSLYSQFCLLKPNEHLLLLNAKHKATDKMTLLTCGLPSLPLQLFALRSFIIFSSVKYCQAWVNRNGLGDHKSSRTTSIDTNIFSDSCIWGILDSNFLHMPWVKWHTKWPNTQACYTDFKSRIKSFPRHLQLPEIHVH